MIGCEPVYHIPFTWGNPWPEPEMRFDIIIASDILLYVRYFLFFFIISYLN